MKTPVREFLLNKITKSDCTSATSNERILLRVTSDFFATSNFSNEQQVIFYEQILLRVTSNFCNK